MVKAERQGASFRNMPSVPRRSLSLELLGAEGWLLRLQCTGSAKVQLWAPDTNFRSQEPIGRMPARARVSDQPILQSSAAGPTFPAHPVIIMFATVSCCVKATT